MKEVKRYLIVYHEEDNDGVFSGALLYDYLVNEKDVSKEHITTVPATYNSIKDIIKYNTVEDLKNRYDSILLTDISFPENIMLDLYKAFGDNFIWIDHHAPIIKASFELGFDKCPGVRNTTKSAILCAYEFLYDFMNAVYQNVVPGEEHPKFPQLLRILSAYDSWSYEREGYDFEYVNAVNKGITNIYKLDFKEATRIARLTRFAYHVNSDLSMDKLKEIIVEAQKAGEFINSYEDYKNKSLLENVGDFTFEACIENDVDERPLFRKCCAIFKQGGSSSTIFKSLKRTHPEISHGLVFKRNRDSSWVISMYNVNDDDWFHCGEFLKKKYGGGGHKGAAGCEVSQDKFIEILKRKQI